MTWNRPILDILARFARRHRPAGEVAATARPHRRQGPRYLLTIAFVGAAGVTGWSGGGQPLPAMTERPHGLAPAGGTAAIGVIEGRPWVIDGDTLGVGGRRIRLYGIDAPEWSQVCRNAWGRDYRCGQQAALALAGHLRRDSVTCEARGIESDGRVVAICRRGGEDLNGWLVAQGWAVTSHPYRLAYAIDELTARVASRGLWAGDFTPPGDWRAESRESRVSLR